MYCPFILIGILFLISNSFRDRLSYSLCERPKYTELTGIRSILQIDFNCLVLIDKLGKSNIIYTVKECIIHFSILFTCRRAPVHHKRDRMV